MTRAPNINRSNVHEELVQNLAVRKLPDTERALFPTIRELLCFSALLGYSEGRRLPLDRDKGVEDVSYQQFERGDAEDLIYLIALAETKNPEILKDDEEGRCAEIFEEYANGGLEIIAEMIRRTGGEYPYRDILKLLKECGYFGDDEKQKSDVSDIVF